MLKLEPPCVLRCAFAEVMSSSWEAAPEAAPEEAAPLADEVNFDFRLSSAPRMRCLGPHGSSYDGSHLLIRERWCGDSLLRYP